MLIANNVSVSSVKGCRYEVEHKLRKISKSLGEVVNSVNRVTDTIGNFLDANYSKVSNSVKEEVMNIGRNVGIDMAVFYSKENCALSIEEAKLLLVKGDHIRILLQNKETGFYLYHHGIYDGNGTVYEYNGRYSSQEDFTFELCSLESFARGKRIELDNRERSLYSPDEIIKRAKTRLGEKAYNLRNNNCENVATWCRCGTPILC